MSKNDRKIEQISIDALIPYARNSRTHSDAQVAQIAASIREFGFTNPVLIDKDGGIIAGHGRVMGARKLGLTDVPCVRLAHLTETQKRAYIIADNKLALNAGWDNELLQLELADLHEADFDMDLLGFDAADLSQAMGFEDALDGEAPAPDTGIDYKEKFAVLVECEDEPHQQQSFEKLTGMGFACKVLVN